MRDPDFHFLAFLRADLRRYRTVIGGQPGAGQPSLLGVLSPRFAPVGLCRLAYALHCARLGWLARLVSLMNFTIFGIEIAVRCPIGPGLVLPHTQGTVIGAARIGANATIFQGVTLGAREIDPAYGAESRPVVGDEVLIGAGAKVLGGLRVGNQVRIGANAVVLDSLPDGALAVGVPARIVIT